LKPVTTGGLPGFEIFHDVLGLPVLEWRQRFRAEELRREELEKAEARRQAEHAEAEKRLAAEHAEAERQLAAEHAEAERRLELERSEKQLAVERAQSQARRRARRVLATVVGAFLLVIAVAASHFALQSGIDRLTQFAEVDSQPEFRLRLLASLAALNEAGRFWPLTSDSGVLEVLREKLTSSPRDGGTYSAFGISADGTYIAWVDEQQRHIVVCPLLHTETCSSSSAASGPSQPHWIQLPAAPLLISASRKLRSGFTPLAVGFLGEDNEPIYYREGILYYRRGEEWKSVDVNTLIRGRDDHGIDSLPGIVSVDFIDGVMRVFVGDWPNNMIFVTIVKSQADAEPPFVASDTRKVEWPMSEGPVNLAPPIFSSQANYAYLERKPAEPSSDQTESIQSENPGSNLVLVIGGPEGRVSVSLDDVQQERSPVLAAAPTRGVLGFSEDGRYIAARHRGLVRVFDVANLNQDPMGRTFIRDRWNGPARDGRGTTWFSPPLGVRAGDAGGNWLFAWASEPGLEVLSGLPAETLSRSQRPNLLLAGMENVYRIEFSRDGRFLFAQAFAGRGRMYARVWDLTKVWEATITNAIENRPSLRELVCHIASIEPNGDQFTFNELIEIGKKWGQPCPASPERPHPF
jgi:hypothetical protein